MDSSHPVAHLSFLKAFFFFFKTSCGLIREKQEEEEKKNNKKKHASSVGAIPPGVQKIKQPTFKREVHFSPTALDPFQEGTEV